MNRRLARRGFRKGWFCRGQSAITTAAQRAGAGYRRGSRIRASTTSSRHPGPADMALVIEVADSSLPDDRSLKARIYAAAAVPVYWIVNLVDHQVEVYTDPTGPDAAPVYRARQDYQAGDLDPVRR